MTAQEIAAKLEKEGFNARVMKNGLVFAGYNTEYPYTTANGIMTALNWDHTVTAWDTTWGVCIMSLEK